MRKIIGIIIVVLILTLFIVLVSCEMSQTSNETQDVFNKEGVREMDNIYSEIRFEKQPRMRIARYVIISPQPENDVINYMDNWAKKSGLLDVAEYTPRKIGWDFRHVSEEQKTHFNLRGYVYCYTLPEDFAPKCDGAQIVYIEADEYAVIRITDPFVEPFVRIGGGWQKVYDYVQNSEYKTKLWDNRYCFEEIIEIDGVTYMDVYVPIK